MAQQAERSFMVYFYFDLNLQWGGQRGTAGLVTTYIRHFNYE
jgi:hypothetical protein